MEDIRQRDLDHLKLMIDYHRHLGLLSFAGLVLTANLSMKIFECPNWKTYALFSIGGFFTAICSSLLSQINHIDLSRKDIIYETPIPNKFALPIVFSMLGTIVGVICMAAFVLLNW